MTQGHHPRKFLNSPSCQSLLPPTHPEEVIFLMFFHPNNDHCLIIFSPHISFACWKTNLLFHPFCCFESHPCCCMHLYLYKTFFLFFCSILLEGVRYEIHFRGHWATEFGEEQRIDLTRTSGLVSSTKKQ